MPKSKICATKLPAWRWPWPKGSRPPRSPALPDGDVEIALRQAMHQAIGEPRITLRAGPAVTEILEPRLTDIAHERAMKAAC